MKYDEQDATYVVYIEPTDEKEDILQALGALDDSTEGVICVLTAPSLKAFQSPRDFHDFKLWKRQQDILVVFVTTNKSFSQWARSNGFLVYTSIESVLQKASARYSLPVAQASGDIYQTVADPKEDEEGDSLLEASLLTPLTPFQIDSIQRSSSSRAQPLLSSEEEEEESDEDLFAQFSSPQPRVPRFKQTAPLAPKSPSFLNVSARRLGLIIMLTIVLVSSVLSAALVFSQKDSKSLASQTTLLSSQPVGFVYFLSSGQLSQMGTSGVNDIVKVSLSHLSAPAGGKSYYAWLRSDADSSDGPALLLGTLSLTSQGNTTLSYADPSHTDLLVTMSRFLVTEESASVPPTVPSPDTSTWRYVGTVSQVPNPKDQKHLSLLDHLRHLLAAEPVLEARGLHGGLALWLYRNSGKLIEWSRSAQDNWPDKTATPLMRRHIIRMLQFLDGLDNVSQDLPAPEPVLVDPVPGSVGLLQIHANQDPASLIQQIGYHLLSLVDSPGASSMQQQLAIQIDAALNAVRADLSTARQDAQKLVVLSDDQLHSQMALTLFNDMVTQVTNAYVGSIDETTGIEQHGSSWIYNTVHSLATIEVTSSRG